MSRDFDKLIADIEAEAQAEGPEAVAQMRTFQTRFRLASQLISMRKARGWSQKQLAELSGIGQPETTTVTIALEQDHVVLRATVNLETVYRRVVALLV